MAAASAAKWAKWCSTYEAKLRTAQHYGHGCLYCQKNCLKDLHGKLGALKQWREDLEKLAKPHQDEELLWLLHKRFEEDIDDDMSTEVGSDHSDNGAASADAEERLGSISDAGSDSPGQVARAQKRSLSPERLDSVSDSGSNSAPQKRPRMDSPDGIPHGYRMDSPAEGDSPKEAPASSFEEASEGERLDSPTKDADEAAKPADKKKRKKKRERARPYSFKLFGIPLCKRAGYYLCQVGSPRRKRIREGLADRRFKGRRPQLRDSETPQTRSVLQFLWLQYHKHAETLPAHCKFDLRETGPFSAKNSKPFARGLARAFDAEALERMVGTATFYSQSLAKPPATTQMGPGLLRGPLRFLPPGKTLYLFWEYKAWAQRARELVACWSLFCKMYRAVHPCLRFRSKSEHSTCHTCDMAKKALSRSRYSPAEHAQEMESYERHLTKVWADRQTYGNSAALSLELGLACKSPPPGTTAKTILTQPNAQVCIIADGIDETKFKVPKHEPKTKDTDKLYRPALHVHGVWAHGFAYQMSIGDADMPVDTNNNVEAISRVLETIYAKYGALPPGVHIQQDNTSRECRNQWIVMWAAMLVALGVFRWVTLAYHQVGHTHEDIDGTFGQACAKLFAARFEDDQERTILATADNTRNTITKTMTIKHNSGAGHKHKTTHSASRTQAQHET